MWPNRLVGFSICYWQAGPEAASHHWIILLLKNNIAFKYKLGLCFPSNHLGKLRLFIDRFKSHGSKNGHSFITSYGILPCLCNRCKAESSKYWSFICKLDGWCGEAGNSSFSSKQADRPAAILTHAQECVHINHGPSLPQIYRLNIDCCLIGWKVVQVYNQKLSSRT